VVPSLATAASAPLFLPEGGFENSPRWSEAQSGESVLNEFARPVGAERTTIGPCFNVHAIALLRSTLCGPRHLVKLPSNQPMPAKPKLGQNFLNDAQAIQRIAASLGDLSGRTVVEIGPGAGAITSALVARAAHVVAIELDPGLAAHLRTQFTLAQLTVHQQDVLTFDFAAAAAAAGQPLLVFGNLPYYITSQILLKLAASHAVPGRAVLDRAILMVQREVAERITAQPGSRDYGLLSVTVQMYGPAEQLFTLPPSSFSPPPDVHSTVFLWRFAPRFTELGVEESSFLPFVRKVFAQKRKTLANNLRAAGIPPATIVSALARAAIDPRARAEALSLETLAALWRALQATHHVE
jgi:16S rRNA (adenine1518-N6/adenine1519-N6)-dimethyltransferase